MSCNAKKDPNGTWRIQYRWTDWTGAKKKSQKRGFKTKKEAEEWYAHFLLQQSSDPTMTLADFWEIYKADMEKRLRKTTMKQKEYVMNDKVLPYFGSTPINEITAPMIRKWQGEIMEKGFKPTYLKTIHNQLSAILNYAVNFYDLRSNPCRKAGSMGKSRADERPYEKCFGQALWDYNAAQKRKDRQKEDYLKEIENSGNKEKTFYENIVQIGKKTDTPVVDENGVLTEEAKAAIEVLERYAKTFQERNPNLYLFNCVMHLDEATPHLHIDYIPVAHGYKNGMKTRNSLTKAFQHMGFAKAVSRKQNETVAWQKREREYLTELCREQGIEIEVLGIQRDNLSLPEYKAAMREVEELEQQAVALDMQNEALGRQNDDLAQRTSELCGQMQEMEAHNDELVLQAQKLIEQIEETEAKEKAAREVLAKHDFRAETLKMISKEAAAETKDMKSAAVPMTNIFGGEEYVKVKKSDWNKLLDAFNRSVSRNHLLEKYEKKISSLEKKIAALTDQVEKLKRFVASRGLGEAFVEFVKSLAPKTMKQRLEEAKSEADVHNRQREMPERGKAGKNRQWQQEM